MKLEMAESLAELHRMAVSHCVIIQHANKGGQQDVARFHGEMLKRVMIEINRIEAIILEFKQLEACNDNF